MSTIDQPLTSTNLPLAGVTVLDLGQVYQGPYATFLMAQAGAEVIKIEPPHGDSVRSRAGQSSYTFTALNAGKRSVVLDLKTPAGIRVLHRLVEHADVLVENFVPGTMERLGCSPEELLRINPRLVYASGSGYGRTGPDRHRPAMDLTIQAAAGVLSVTGEPQGLPTRAGPAIADFIAGIHLYGAAVTALLARDRTGHGGVAEVSMVEALVPTMLSSMAWMFDRGKVPPRTHNRHAGESVAPHNVYPAKDGWVAILCLNDEQWSRLTRAMQRPELATRPQFASIARRIANHDELDDAIAAWTRSYRATEISDRCAEHRVPASVVRTIDQVLSDPGLHDRGFLREVDRAEGAPATFFNSPLRFGSAAPAPGTAADLGEHTHEVLQQLLHTDDDTFESWRRLGAFGSLPGRAAPLTPGTSGPSHD